VNSLPDLASDRTLCDLEPITRLERIQSCGFLLAMSSDWVVVRASVNLDLFIGVDALTAIGKLLDSLVDTEVLHDIRNRLTGLAATGGTERLYGIELVPGRPLVDLAIHYAGTLCILEGESAGGDNRSDAASLVRKMIAHLRKQTTLDAFHRDAARQIRKMTGFGRVMIYRFLPDGAGEVIAEEVVDEMQSFLGLHYPASDIPIQARALYLRNSFRIIADVHAATVPLVSSARDAGEPLDLSLAITRAVSPVHIEYLKNMGVAASLSISIIIDGALWGLIACHHSAARLPTFVIRTAAELFGEMYSLKLEARLRRAEDHDERHARESAIRMLTSVAANNELLTHASWLQDALRQMIPCDGIAVCFKGHLSLSGSTPPAADVEGIAGLLRLLLPTQLLVSDNIGALRPESVAHAALAAGVLGIPLSHTQGDYIMLFRRERLRDIKWAGEPVKIETRGGSIPQLSPRKSFDAFTKSIRGFSRPFSAPEYRVAEALQSGLMEIILRESKHVDAGHQRATDRQELLIAELNHRVRNVLALIRGLISQTVGEEGDAASYVKSLNGRVQALARAHDRVTRQNWGPGSLNAIFDDEIAAYVPTQRHRFTIHGATILLQPRAFSALALIIHELVTNCSKHGSLSANGRVEVMLDHRQGTGLFMKWCEFDGPPVRVPTRRGFGSVIIERVLPFDLQGTALVHYLPWGLEADFFVPDQHVASALIAAEGIAEALTPSRSLASPIEGRPLEGLGVLLLEDNLIVALEAEDMLRTLGASFVYTASTIATALSVLEAEPVHFAVLDINLGVETSLEFASRMRSSRIPFIFASGYGENINVGGPNHSVLTITKPYDRDDLRFAVSSTLDGYADHPGELGIMRPNDERRLH
jgi:light-regulated signal transduction histidine kinase (bacteriophytochrome)